MTNQGGKMTGNSVREAGYHQGNQDGHQEILGKNVGLGVLGVLAVGAAIYGMAKGIDKLKDISTTNHENKLPAMKGPGITPQPDDENDGASAADEAATEPDSSKLNPQERAGVVKNAQSETEVVTLETNNQLSPLKYAETVLAGATGPAAPDSARASPNREPLDTNSVKSQLDEVRENHGDVDGSAKSEGTAPGDKNSPTGPGILPKFWVSLLIVAVISTIGIMLLNFLGENRAQGAIFYTILGAAVAIGSLIILVNQARSSDYVALHPTTKKEYVELGTSCAGIVFSILGFYLGLPEAMVEINSLLTN